MSLEKNKEWTLFVETGIINCQMTKVWLSPSWKETWTFNARSKWHNSYEFLENLSGLTRLQQLSWRRGRLSPWRSGPGCRQCTGRWLWGLTSFRQTSDLGDSEQREQGVRPARSWDWRAVAWGEEPPPPSCQHWLRHLSQDSPGSDWEPVSGLDWSSFPFLAPKEKLQKSLRAQWQTIWRKL